MTDRAALDLCFMLVNKGTLLVGVALVADLILPFDTLQLVRLKSTVRIVAIVALDQSFVHTVMEWPDELRLHIQMTRVTKLWRRLFQQELALFGVMWGMAVNAGNTALQVRRSPVIALLVAVLVAIQATRADLRGRGVLKCENLRLVPAAVHVRLAGPVARFATMPLGAIVSFEFSLHRGYEVWSFLKVRVDFVVAGLAGIGADIKRRIRRPHIFCFLRVCWLRTIIPFGSLWRICR